MPETGQARVVDCHQSAAGNWGAIHRERPEPAAREVSLQDQRIMAGAKNDAVKHRVHPEDLAWRAHPPRAWLDAPRVQLFPVPPLAESSELRSEEHTSELQSHSDLVCRLLLDKKK